MWEQIAVFFDQLLGLDLAPGDLELGHMAWRGVIVFAFAVLLVRLGARRLLAHSAGFDIMVAIILGSVLSRGINGEADFAATLGVSALLVTLHHTLATLAFHWHPLSQLVKGRPHVLVRDGVADREQMRRSKITDDDLDENLRLHGNVDDLKSVAEARLERNGAVSVVRMKDGAEARTAKRQAAASTSESGYPQSEPPDGWPHSPASGR